MILYIKRDVSSKVIGTAKHPNPDMLESLNDDHPDILDFEYRAELKTRLNDAYAALLEIEAERLLGIEEAKYEIDPNDPTIPTEAKQYFDAVSNRPKRDK